MLHWRDQLESILQTPYPHTGAHMQIGDLYTHGGKAYIVKAYHPNPKRILLYDASDGRVFSILKSIVRTGYTSSTQEGA